MELKRKNVVQELKRRRQEAREPRLVVRIVVEDMVGHLQRVAYQKRKKRSRFQWADFSRALQAREPLTCVSDHGVRDGGHRIPSYSRSPFVAVHIEGLLHGAVGVRSRVANHGGAQKLFLPLETKNKRQARILWGSSNLARVPY